MWQPQIEALTAHFRVLRYDTHGHGKTTKNGKVTLAQLGEDVIALLDHLNIDRARFCGISMGGLTGLWLGRFAPERFHGLAVANTAARIGDQASWLSRARAVRQEGWRWWPPGGRPLVHPRVSPEGAGGGRGALSPADPYRC